MGAWKEAILGGLYAGSTANQANASKDASKAQVDSVNQGIDFQRESRDIARQDLQPYSDMGKESINRLQQLAQPGGTQPAPQINWLSLNPATQGITGTYGGDRYENGRIVQNTPVSNQPSGSEYGDMREGVTLNPNYDASYQDFNRDTEFTGTVDQLDANTRFDANVQDINRDTEFRADPRRVYNDAEANVQDRFNEAADVVSDQVSARQAAKGKLGSGNTLVDLFRENTMLKEGLTQNEFGRLRRLEDRDRMNLAQDAQIFGDNQSRELQDADFNRGSELARAGLFDQNFNRDVRFNDANRLNTLANANLFNQNYGRDMAKAGFNQGAEQLREQNANNNFVRNMDVAGLNRNEIAMKDALKGADFNRNLNLVNMGQASAAGQAATTNNAGNSIANLYGQQGNAIAAGKIGSANAYTGGVNNLTSLAGLYMGIPPTATKTINTNQPMSTPQDFYKYFV